MVKVLITDPVHEILIEKLERYGLDVTYKPGISRDELLSIIGGYEVLVVRSRTRVDRELLERGVKLKIVARAGSGTDNIDTEYARRLGVKVINVPEAPVESVAELTIALIILACRRIIEAYNMVKRGKWYRPMGYEVYGKTLAIIGLGRIGSRVAEIAKALGMRVIAYDVADVTDKARRIGVELVPSLHDALKVADIVSLHVPLKNDTYHMISWREFKVMKRGCILVNTARGAVVDSEALLWALDNEIVSVAVLDVLEEEPPKSPILKKLISHPKVIVTPHLGSQTYETQERIGRLLADKIVEALRS